MAEQAEPRDNPLKTDLLATLSHELRSPLTSIKGYASTLLRHENRLSREERHEFLLAINQASDRLTSVINHLLEISEFDTGAIALERTPVHLAHLVYEAVAVAEQRLGGGRADEPPEGIPFVRCTFTVRLENIDEGQTVPEPIVQADRSRLREVLDHLLENAAMYSPTGGCVEVVVHPVISNEGLKLPPGSSQSPEMRRSSALQRERRMVAISIHDSGAGIPTEHLEVIFDHFYRIDTQLTREVNGLGLGLAICKRIVELHGGAIWAESDVGKGSTFYISLPIDGNAESERA